MRVEIYGASDDLVEIRIDGKDQDEFGCYSSNKCPTVNATVRVETIGGAQGIDVYAVYNGCWSFAVGQVDEERSLPHGWTFALEQEHSYSTRLVIVTDEIVIVRKLGDDEK